MQLSWKITPLLLLPLILSTVSHPLDSRLLGIAHNPDVPKVENHDDHLFLDDNVFQNTMLHEHNSLRREHGVGELTWDPALANYAEAHAHKCEWGHSVCISLPPLSPMTNSSSSTAPTARTSPPTRTSVVPHGWRRPGAPKNARNTTTVRARTPSS